VIVLLGQQEAPASKTKTDCRFYAGYILTTRSPWFRDSVMLSNHSHIPNVTTPLLQSGLLWIMADIFA